MKLKDLMAICGSDPEVELYMDPLQRGYGISLEKIKEAVWVYECITTTTFTDGYTTIPSKGFYTDRQIEALRKYPGPHG